MNIRLQSKSPLHWLMDADQDFEHFWAFPEERKKQAFPACDFHEDKSHYFISMDLPGLKKKDIKVNYENQVLTISGKREEEYKKEDEKARSRLVEKFYGSFQRSFTVPSTVDEGKISTQFSNGVLEILLPKTNKKRGREIPVMEGREDAGLVSKFLKNKKETA